MVKAVFKLELPDEKTKKRAMKTVSGFSGVDSISIDTKDNKLTVTGDFNPVNLVSKLRKLWPTDILSVEPAKEAEKKEEAKKEEPKKQGGNKKDTNKDDVAELVKAYKAYNPYLTTHYYVNSAEENPNSCVIC